MTETRNVGALVAALPEKYQPIFAHPELSDGSSRGCEDRLVLIRECARQLQAAMGRPLRVLDLGCAQGFFSLSLAAEGHRVHGVDYLDLNVNVCEALAAQHPSFQSTFEHGTVEDVIDRLEPGEFDLVLGLSVFHHLVHARGVVSVSELCRKLSEVAGAGIFELAVREEPLYWAPSLPQDPAELLSSYSFTRLLSRQSTHLSTVSRPLIYASSKYWYVDNVVGEFTSWSGESHAHGRGTHQHSRRYYFGKQVFVKKMTLGLGARAQINLQEFHNEVAFLRDPPASYPAPRLIAELDDSSDLFLVRELMEGRLLSELIDANDAYDADQVLSQLLDQLVTLEQAGLYHNDVRCWNVLMTPEGRAVLIDYGAISPVAMDCSWLGDLLLSFLITTREILGRQIVQTSPDREPALDLASLPSRYRGAFIRVLSQSEAKWTFAELKRALAQAGMGDDPLPEWMPIYQRLQGALSSYNARLAALHGQTVHDRAELAARATAYEGALAEAHEAQEAMSALKKAADAADKQFRDMEESNRQLAEWAKSLEARAVDAGAESQRIAMRMEEVEADNARLVSRLGELDQELVEYHHVRQLAETLAADVARLTGERDSVLAKASDAHDLAEQHEATIHHLRGKIAALNHRIERLERSRTHDRRRLKDLQTELSEGAQSMGSSRVRLRELEMAVETLEGRIRVIQASRSWRLTAPLRWFTSKVLKRGGALSGNSGARKPRKVAAAREGKLLSPADVVTDKRLAAVDQLASRIRKSRR